MILLWNCFPGSVGLMEPVFTFLQNGFIHVSVCNYLFLPTQLNQSKALFVSQKTCFEFFKICLAFVLNFSMFVSMWICFPKSMFLERKYFEKNVFSVSV